MRVVLPSIVCLFLAVSFGNFAYGKAKDKNEKEESCPSQPHEEGMSSLMAEATSTGRIHNKPARFYQFFNEKCHMQERREYRTADGRCNHVFNLGSANTPFRRMLPAMYGDYINSPRSYATNGSLLPSPTDVSRLIHSHRNARSDLTTMFMQWGQFVDHDITLTPVPSKSDETIKCCGPDKTYPDFKIHPECHPIKLSEEDANKRFRGNCMEFVRSLPSREKNGRQHIPREQINQLTAFMDGSMIYGSSDDLQKQLRETTSKGKPGAKMRTTGNDLLPNATVKDCILRKNEYCFLAGDGRVNVQPGLIVIHTMWVRLHNMIVDELAKKRPNDSPEDLFQEARKIVIGILQNIHYREWLPLVIGDKMQKLYHLTPGKGKGDRVGYSSRIDPQLTSAFSTAAFRFGHSTIPEHLIVNKKTFRFQDMFFRPDLVFEDFDGVVGALVDSAQKSLAQKTDRFVVEDITSHLFEPENQTEGAPSDGLDLIGLNIQRGRDHGLPPYNKFRKICGLPPIENFTEFGDAAANLSPVYSSVDDIDLFVGGLLEKPQKGAQVGPTFACIIAEQFHALKYGDRFYFETNRMPEGFTDGQLAEIREVKFAQVCCLTSKIDKVPKMVFSKKGGNADCKKLKKNFLNFGLWKK